MVTPLRAQIVTKSNWVRFKAYRLRETDIEDTFHRYGSSGRRITVNKQMIPSKLVEVREVRAVAVTRNRILPDAHSNTANR